MAEGLDPIEAGKKLHEHGEKHHEHAADGDGKGDDRHSRIVQVCEALLLALVTITAAWAGYSAARWGTASRVDIAQSSTLRNLATRDDLAPHADYVIEADGMSTVQVVNAIVEWLHKKKIEI